MGISDFELLRATVGRKGSRGAFLYTFDLLELDGIDLRREAWETRRTTLASLLRKAVDGIRLSEHIQGTDGFTIFGHACRMGLEGHRRQTPRSALSVRSIAGLDQGQKPGRAGGD
jgi:bifunctional non-homologous end joining protein LigD